MLLVLIYGAIFRKFLVNLLLRWRVNLFFQNILTCLVSKYILLTTSFDFHLVALTGIETISSQACRNLFMLSSTCWHNRHILWVVDHLFVTLVLNLIIIVLSTLTSMTILSNFGSTWLEAIIYNEGRFVNI